MYVKLEKPNWDNLPLGLYKKLDISPRRLLEVFSEPTNDEISGDGKVTKSWEFRSLLNGQYFAIWDFDQTIESGDDDLPSLSEFWESDEPVAFSICSEHVSIQDSEEFMAWVQEKLI